MVIDGFSKPLAPFSLAELQGWSNRHFGIGFDQLLLVEPAQAEGVDFRYRIFNADGSEVEQCGNGARCFARFVVEKGLTDKSEIRVETASGEIVLYVMDDGRVKVNMGRPRFAPSDLPMLAEKQRDEYFLDSPAGEIGFGAVSMGNPHITLKVDDIQAAPVDLLGPFLEPHAIFPKRVNVGFMQVVNPHQINLRVYERGAGETLACGTGACAAVVIGQLQGYLQPGVDVHLPGGQLTIDWAGQAQDVVWMTGPAVTVFEGEVVRHG
jgi:diaminopimelate epimerase